MCLSFLPLVLDRMMLSAGFLLNDSLKGRIGDRRNMKVVVLFGSIFLLLDRRLHAFSPHSRVPFPSTGALNLARRECNDGGIDVSDLGLTMEDLDVPLP